MEEFLNYRDAVDGDIPDAVKRASRLRVIIDAGYACSAFALKG
tara:strand:- start:456 stop:584 length:129 start_codon:yes stop_codon:yes gene_type:complete